MNQRALSLFLSLADTLHFAQASEQSHVSPSTLSRIIKQLEDEVGVALFERDNRHVALTHQGQIFREYAHEQLQRWEALQHQLMENAQQLKGSVSIYCSVTASYSFLYQLLSDFRDHHPGIEIKIHTGDPDLAISRVLNDQEDIAIAAQPEPLPPELAFLPITESPLVFIAAKEQQIRQNSESWQQLPFILPERGIARERADRWFHKKGIRPRIYAQAAGNEAIVSMVSLGFGVGLVPKIVLDNSPLAERVQILPSEPELKSYEVGLFTTKRKLKSPLIRAFWFDSGSW